MASIVYGSRLFGGIFGTPEMTALFTDEALVARYIDVEVALADAQAAVGIVPPEAAKAIAETANPARLDWDRYAARTQAVGVPILPLVEQMTGWAPDGLGQWCHYGATTQDIMDTTDVLQMRAGFDLIRADLDAVAAALARLAEDHADTPMAGRSHLQHALPITFGFKAAGWLSAIDRHRARLVDLRPRVEVVSFGGAVGTLASLGDKGLPVRDALAAKLGLGVTGMTWHTARDSVAEATGFLALLGGTLGKIGTDIALMMQSETGEVLEPYAPGRGASSTMPQKRNPIAAETMIAAAKGLRECHGIVLDAMLQDHERGTGPWHLEWQAVPRAFLTAAGALRAAREALEGLEVRPEAMVKGLHTTGGLIVAEAVMMGLAPKLGRQVAHDLVQESCRRSLTDGTPFLDSLCATPEIAVAADRDELAAFADPANYLGSGPEMVRRYLKTRS